MAQRDLIKYYNEVEKQYFEMVEDLKELTELCSNNIVSPERLEEYQKTIDPLKKNYMTLSYCMFLLNKPKRNKKGEVYKNQNKKLLSHCITNEEVLQENKEVLDKLKKDMENDK